MNISKYTDKYFTRTKQILEAGGLNPFVRAQVFVRKGPGVVAGLDEAVKFIAENSEIAKNGGRIYALKDGDKYDSKETQMIIESPIQDIVELETLYLGILSAGITRANDGIEPDLNEITKRTRAVVEASGERPVLYFGARHWDYREDEKIAGAAFEGGAVAASTDAGASNIGSVGVGTIPHVLENIYAWKFGKDNAVLEATKAFDRVISPEVPRIALIDYNNKEICDSISVANTLKSLKGVRVDTCGENVAQGAIEKYSPEEVQRVFGKDVKIPEQDMKYWFGSGVTVSGVYSLRKALNERGFGTIETIVTSGFGSVSKVDAFCRAEEILGMKLFDGLGVGQLYHSRASTMDVVAVGDNIDSMFRMNKVGREYRPNSRLERRL